MVPATLGILQKLKKHHGTVDVTVDQGSNELVVDKPFPMSDDRIPLRQGKAPQAAQLVRQISTKFGQGVDPTPQDAEDVLSVVDTDGIDWSKYK
ncbi:MAG: hypothetical protein AB1758_07990 [Candidatus Eremiobacterota bacterium]